MEWAILVQKQTNKRWPNQPIEKPLIELDCLPRNKRKRENTIRGACLGAELRRLGWEVGFLWRIIICCLVSRSSTISVLRFTLGNIFFTWLAFLFLFMVVFICSIRRVFTDCLGAFYDDIRRKWEMYTVPGIINLGLSCFIVQFPLPLPFLRFPALRFPALRLRARIYKWYRLNTNRNADRTIPSSLWTSSFSLALVPLVVSLSIISLTVSITEFVIFCWRIWEAFAMISSIQISSPYLKFTQWHINSLHEICQTLYSGKKSFTTTRLHNLFFAFHFSTDNSMVFLTRDLQPTLIITTFILFLFLLSAM